MCASVRSLESGLAVPPSLPKRGRHQKHLSKELVSALGPGRLADILLDCAAADDRVLSVLWDAVDAAASTAPALADKDLNPDSFHMVGSSTAIRQVFKTIRKFAGAGAPVLITGESGTGKELAALAIHERSPGRSGPFVPINCAGLPRDLVASELFGHEKGAFTGAHQRRIGRIEAARGGTVFLDEIGDMPLEAQAHLLRFLQEKSIDRVGGCTAIPVDVRIIAATNSDLKKAISAGQFRADLFYRLNVLTLDMPPLRARDDDVELLSAYFVKRLSRELGGPVVRLSADAAQALRAYDWPGNVRELISCLRRAIVMTAGARISAADLALPTAPKAAEPTERQPLDRARQRVERDLLEQTLHRRRWNVTRTAADLGVSRVTVYRLMVKYRLQGRSRKDRQAGDSPAG